MRRILTLFLLSFSLFLFSSVHVNADVGPKRSIQITIKGVNQDYSLDLIEPAGNSHSGFEAEIEESYYYKDDYPEELVGFQDRDGFISYQLYNGIGTIRQTRDHVYTANYHGPSTYKIVLVMDDGSIIISKQIVNMVFDTVVTWDLEDVDLSESSYDLGKLTGNMGIGTPDDYEGEYKIVWMTAWRTIVRVLATLVFELAVLLFIFRYKRNQTLKIVVVTNVITQTILSAFMVLGYFVGNWFGLLGVLFIGEFLVYLTEVIVYIKLFDEGTKWKAFWYAVVANSVSLIGGLIITDFIH